jgi:hypothetical protein
MSILSLSFNNKNKYRKYPLKQTANLKSTAGFVVGDSLIVNASITTLYGRHRIYIKQIHYKDSVLRITIASLLDELVLGCFIGEVLSEDTTLTLTPFVRNVSGSITIGNLETVSNIDRALVFLPENSEFEESTIFCYTPPKVTSIVDKKYSELRGYVNFGVLTNLTKTSSSSNKHAKFQATYPERLFNPADQSIYLNNCPTPIIKNINGVFPSSPGGASPINDWNIYIAGIKPIVFYGIPGILENTTEPGTIGVDTGDLNIDALCTLKHKVLPPVNVCGFTLPAIEFKDKYYSKPELPVLEVGECSTERPQRSASNFNNTTLPEYYFWPQFVKESYYENWSSPT